MRFEKWEEEAFNYLTALYENFFKELSEKCMDCFRIDSKELFSENVKELTEEQEKMIKDYWEKYTKDFDIEYHKSYGGKGVKFLSNPTRDELNDYFDKLEEENLIFQETVKQSEETAKLHPDSLNTIRIMTLIIDGEVKVLPWCAFRMGIGKSKVDNASFGGIYCKIEDDGTLSNFAYDALGNRFNKHPDGGDFSNVKFDFMDKVKKLVKEAAQRFPHFRLIGWDIAISEENEPIIIEANLTMSGMDVIETICGPLFGEYTEKVLEEVFLKKHKKKTSMDISQYV